MEEGFFRSAYQLYREAGLRDVHMDLPYVWQSAYISPNEGGSGNTTPLYIDLSFILLGWAALRDIARQTAPVTDGSRIFHHMSLPPYRVGDDALILPEGANAIEQALSWGKAGMTLPRADLERSVFQFQRNFVGGKSRDVEAIVTAGGTRSGNVAFESVLARAKDSLGPVPITLITGNPHLLVERAERRFKFNVVRVHKDGIICIDGLKREISNPSVAAVYAQTLSITDGITDPLAEVIAVIEEENKKRQASGGLLVTLINDCCLALSVLLHNDGQNGSKCLRVLDLTENCITPAIVMLDAHKHIGADKGISMAMGTPGTLSHLSGHARVGAPPSVGELVRARADMALVGVDGYYEKYRNLVEAIEVATRTFEAAGLKFVHGHHRAKGSTAFGIEDPSGCTAKKLKKLGHGPAPLFGISPENPDRCQTGFLLSLTPHCLRELDDGKPALDVFVRDLVQVKKTAKTASLAAPFSENSLPGFLLSGGNEECWMCVQLREPGLGRDVISVVFRRLYSGILDSGVACSDRHASPLRELAKRSLVSAIPLLLAWLQFGRMRSRKRSKL